METEADLVVSGGQYADILRRRRRAVLLGLALSVLASALAYAFAGGGPSLRTAAATVEVFPVTTDRLGSNTRLRDLVSMETEAEIMRSTAVARRVIERLELDTSPERLLGSVTVENPENTLVLSVEVSAGDASSAQTRAQAFAEEYLGYREETLTEFIEGSIERTSSQARDVQRQLDEVNRQIAPLPDGSAARVSLASTRDQLQVRLADFQRSIAALQGVLVDPGNVVSAARPLAFTGAPGWITALGVLGIGVLVSLAAAVLVDRLDQRPRDELELASAVLAPVFGVAPVLPAGDDGGGHPGGVRGTKARRTLGEYRRLRLLLAAEGDHRVSSVLVVTPVDDGAAGEVATNLVRVLARARERCVLIWCEDVRRAALEELGVDAESQLDDVLQGKRQLLDALQDVPGHPGVSVVGLSVGRTSSVAARSLRRIFEELEEAFDAVVTVAPSSSAADMAELAAFVDGVVVAVDTQRAPRKAIARTIATLDAVNARLVAVFVTRARPWW